MLRWGLCPETYTFISNARAQSKTKFYIFLLFFNFKQIYFEITGNVLVSLLTAGYVTILHGVELFLITKMPRNYSYINHMSNYAPYLLLESMKICISISY